jgi:hypothetical protein
MTGRDDDDKPGYWTAGVFAGVNKNDFGRDRFVHRRFAN